MEKMTKMQKFERVLEFVKEDEMLAEFVRKEMEQLANRNAHKSEKKEKPEDVELKARMVEFVAANPEATVKAVREAMGVSSQKAAPMLKKLVTEGKLTVEVAGKEKKFTVVEA